MKNRNLIKTGLFLILFLPLLFTPFTFFPWHYGKTVFFQIIVEVLAIIFLWRRFLCHPERGACLTGRQKGSLAFRGYLNSLDYSVLFFLLIITITSFTGVNPINSFWGNQFRANGVFTWLHFGVFYFLLSRFLPEDKNRRTYALAGIIAAFLVALTALFPQVLPNTWRSIAGGGIIGNRAFLASYLILALGLVVYLLSKLVQKSLFYKRYFFWLGVLVISLFIFILFKIGNRSAWVGLTAGIISGLFFVLLIFKTRKVKIYTVAVLLLIFGSFSALFFFREQLWLKNLSPTLHSLSNFSYSSGTGETRLMAWKIAYQGLKERPILGWGMGNYDTIFNRYYNPQFLKYNFAETVWDKPHNWLLEIGDSAGIAGLVSYLAIFVAAGYVLFKKVKKNPELSAVVIFSVLIANFVQNLFLFETTNSLILWFAILAMISAEYRETRPVPLKIETQPPPGRPWSATAFFLFLIFVLFSYWVYYLPLKASYQMRQAELTTALVDWMSRARAALAASSHPIVLENAVFLAEQFSKFDKANAIVNSPELEETALRIAAVLEEGARNYPDNLSFPIWAGQVYLALGEKVDKKYYQDAERKLLAAKAIAPRRQEVLFLLGRLYLLEQKIDAALEMQKQAVALAPNISNSHWFLGLTYVAAGDRSLGLTEIEEAVKLGYALSVNQKLYVLDIYALEENYAKLIEEYQKLIELEPENVSWHIKLATVYAISGNKEKALEITRIAVSLFPPLETEAKKFIKQYKLE